MGKLINDWETPESLTLIEGWARQGMTEEQVAHNMGISRRTLFTWKNNSLPILQALKKGKEVVDYEVESSLFRRAVGYTTTETREEGDKIIITTRTVPPDTGACIFWLKNRMPDKWREKPLDDKGEDSLNRIVEAISNVK